VRPSCSQASSRLNCSLTTYVSLLAEKGTNNGTWWVSDVGSSVLSPLFSSRYWQAFLANNAVTFSRLITAFSSSAETENMYAVYEVVSTLWSSLAITCSSLNTASFFHISQIPELLQLSGSVVNSELTCSTFVPECLYSEKLRTISFVIIFLLFLGLKKKKKCLRK